MPIEVEQKFRVEDFRPIEQALASLASAPAETIEQIDRYFNHPGRDFAQTDEALRLRRVGERNYITYKGPKLDSRSKTRAEIEIELAAGSQPAVEAAQLLTSLSFQPVAEVCKRRTCFHVTWEGRAAEVALDEVAGLGTFVELEMITQQSEMTAAGDSLTSLARHLNLTNTERRSYLELLLESRK